MQGCLFRIIRTATNLSQDSKSLLELKYSRCIAEHIEFGHAKPAEHPNYAGIGGNCPYCVICAVIEQACR